MNSELPQTTTAFDALRRLAELHEERAIAEMTGLLDDADYVADLEDDIQASHRFYVGLAVTELATLRAEIDGARPQG